ncbi:MAG: class I SAM-dependent methyltransferase [Minisyncoccia bacterium]
MTILRKAEYRALRAVSLQGAVLDLGGERRSKYHELFKGTFSITIANLGGEPAPDVTLDLEEPLPFADASYDSVLLINVLEHVFEYRRLLSECARVLRPGGTLVIVVPFLFPYHPSPNDFHRYTAPALSLAIFKAGLKDISITTLGSGLFSAGWLMLERLLPQFLSPLWNLIGMFAVGIDWLFVKLARILGKKYDPADYALGYVVTARAAS